MTGSVPGAAGAGCRRWLAVLGLGAIVATGCAAFREAPLDVPPGQQAVVGEVFISGFSMPHVVLDIARDDGTYQHELAVDAIRSPFVITLPPGRYQVTRLRINDGGRVFPDEAWFRIGVVFDVGNTAVYVGSLFLERVVFGRQLRVIVDDDYERALPTMRARYPELPPVVVRAIMRPG
jgi:hypothetical protein